MKQRYYSFFRGIDVIEMAERFWDENIVKIRAWYQSLHRHDDLVITASPEFLIKPICRRLGIRNLIASEVDPKTGKTLSRNCRDWEKVRRYRRVYGDTLVPAGDYRALRVVIGEGQGHNWWCVLYPSLCYPEDWKTGDGALYSSVWNWLKALFGGGDA